MTSKSTTSDDPVTLSEIENIGGSLDTEAVPYGASLLTAYMRRRHGSIGSQVSPDQNELANFIKELLWELKQLAESAVLDDLLVRHLAEAHQRAETIEAATAGLRTSTSIANDWVTKLEPEFKNLNRNSVVAISVATGEFVIGKTSLEAMDLFEAKFGVGTKGLLHHLNGPVLVGGGFWRSK